MIGQSTKQQRRVEFDIHGLLGIRLVDSSSDDIAAIRKQLGVVEQSLSREADVTLRFVKHLPTAHLRHLGGEQLGFTADGFVVITEGTTGTRAMIPFERLGEPCEVICESGLPSVPLLMQILGFSALAKGYVAVHGSAFVHNGVGVLMAGWADSGKTTALLGFASQGAEFVGDEWLLVGGDAKKMYGLPTEIQLSSAHLENLPNVRRAVKRSRRWLIDGLRSLGNVVETSLWKSAQGTFGGKVLRKALRALQAWATPDLPPGVIFGDCIGPMVARLEKVFLLVNHDDPSIRVETTAPSDMALQMAYSAQHEQIKFMEYYLAFKSAFPQKKNSLVERSFVHQWNILSRALAGNETYTVLHPYPLVFSDLYEKIQPFCETRKKTSEKIPQNSTRQSEIACKS